MKADKAEDSSGSNRCFVCEHPDGGSAHFGSTSCLACAAFFRRTVSLNIKFVCKKENSCTIYYELRMICRACRFDKCVAAGMKKECVQKRRSNKKVPKKHLAACENTFIKAEIEDPKYDCASDHTDDNSPLSIEKKSPAVPSMIDDSPSMSDNFYKDEVQNIPSTSSISSSPYVPQKSATNEPELERAPSPNSSVFPEINMTGPDLLRYYVDQLGHSMDRRRMVFTETPLLAVMEDRGDMPFTSINPPAHSLKRQYESQRFDNLLAFDFCKSCPGFELLDPMERAIFFRTCSLTYCLLDIAWITVEAFNEEPANPVVMYTDGSICTVRDMSYGWDDEDDICAMEKKKLFFNFVARFHEAVCQPFRKLKLTPVEYAALRALCIWKLGYCEYTQHMKLIGKEHEQALFVGLRLYYEDMFEDQVEASVRLGNLILLMGTVFEMNQLILETYKSAELFELFKLDTLSKLLLTL